MSYATAVAAVDLAFSSRQSQVKVEFFGGEPFLEFDLMRRTVDYARRACPQEKSVTFGIITNGTLLRSEQLSFLIDNDFKVLLSFDGPPPAQDVRGRGTFAPLDRLLDTLRNDHPHYLRSRFSISGTYTASTYHLMAGALEYFLGKGVRSVYLTPVYTHDPTWRVDSLDVLEDQFQEMFQISKVHYECTGEVPYRIFSPDPHGDEHSPRGRSMCGVMRGETPTVDVDGQVHGCATFAGSYQTFPSEFLRSRVESMSMGSVHDPELRARYRAFPIAVREAGLFHQKHQKYSSLRKCAECEYLAECSVCPTSIGHIPGNQDPNRIPDSLCAFNLISLKYRAKFAEYLRGATRPKTVYDFLLSTGQGLRRSTHRAEGVTGG
jgi:sulfatase maturation enzyme AslB (radical SAM superfamily)